MKTIKAKVHILPTEESYIYYNSLRNELINTFDWGDEDMFNFDWNDDYIPQHLYITTDEEIKEGDWYITDDLKLLQCNKVLLNLVYADGDYGRNPNGVRKIIATTDPKLFVKIKEYKDLEGTLPQIPQSFIEEYCKAGGIDEVLVELEYDLSTTVNTSDLVKGREYVVFEDGEQSGEGFFLEIHDKVGVCLCFDEELKDVEDYYTERKGQFFIDKTSVIIKKNPDNTIVIHPVKEKMIPLSEVKELIKKYNSDLFTAQTMELPFDGNKWIEENL